MFRPILYLLDKIPIDRWCLAAVFVVCLGVSGCANLNLRGEPFSSDQTFDFSGQVRRPNNQIDFFGFSNRARQVEQHLGAR